MTELIVTLVYGISDITRYLLMGNVKHYRAGHTTEPATLVLVHLIHLYLSMSQQPKDLVVRARDTEACD
jgi:hypothetical protein